ncbi:MAG: DUF4964 domain-containing protein [Chitinophagaceae bacterium]
MKKTILAALLFLVIQGYTQQQAPAYPLITHDPYFSIWSGTDELNASVTKHWTGAEQPLIGMVKVDGVTYSVLGKQRKLYEPVLPSSEEESYTAKFTETAPASDWMLPGFDDAAWQSGKAPFGDNATTAGTS